jgi:hypothetical protein
LCILGPPLQAGDRAKLEQAGSVTLFGARVDIVPIGGAQSEVIQALSKWQPIGGAQSEVIQALSKWQPNFAE